MRESLRTRAIPSRFRIILNCNLLSMGGIRPKKPPSASAGKEEGRATNARPESQRSRRNCSDEFVDQVLQEFLAAALVGLHLAHLQRVVGQFLKTDFALLNKLADAAVEAAVALLHKGIESAVFADGRGD